MKLQSNNLLDNLTTNEIKFLTTEVEVKETICKDFVKERKRNFTAAEFWEIQRRKKNRLIKRII
ncbi:MAG TPA: hypothetical protein VMU83_01205 [Hanamia sp.]|nr:hypothetical protein [Hanamia sp.]